MRYRVDLKGGGYISYDQSDEKKAWKIYEERGIRILRCDDIFDDGVVIDGMMIVNDYTRNSINEN